MARDPEKTREYNRRYREKNRARLLEYGRRYREEHREELRDYHRTSRAIEANRARKRVAPYELTQDELAAMNEKQGGRCAICGELPSGKGPNAVLHIDHDHETGKVRGLLCQACNRGLGFFRDDPERLRAAIGYLHPED